MVSGTPHAFYAGGTTDTGYNIKPKSWYDLPVGTYIILFYHSNSWNYAYGQTIYINDVIAISEGRL